MLDEKQIAELRAKHGEVSVIEFMSDDGQDLQVVLRRPVGSMDPKVDEYLAFSTKRMAMEQAPAQVRDPGDNGIRELLDCVVSDNIAELRAHLDEYPSDQQELFSALTALAGFHSVADAAELADDDAKAKFHKRCFGIRCGAWSSLVRPMTGSEFARFLQKNGGTMRPLRAEAMAWAAWSCVQEAPDKEKKKPLFEQALSEAPFLAMFIGLALIGMAGSRVSEREKK